MVGGDHGRRNALNGQIFPVGLDGGTGVRIRKDFYLKSLGGYKFFNFLGQRLQVEGFLDESARAVFQVFFIAVA